MTALKKEDFRPVEVHGHHFFQTGYFHGYTEEHKYALVEDNNGNVKKHDLSLRWLKFTDRKE